MLKTTEAHENDLCLLSTVLVQIFASSTVEFAPRLFILVDCRDSASEMSFDASYGLSERPSPSIVLKRKSIDCGDANSPSPKRAHISQPKDDTHHAGRQTHYWMVQW